MRAVKNYSHSFSWLIAFFHLNHSIVFFANRILFLPLSEYLLGLIFLNCLQAKRHELLISYLFTLVKVLNATICSDVFIPFMGSLQIKHPFQFIHLFIAHAFGYKAHGAC